ncbi:bacteriohemerythrin [Candidatus Latescibacterota bacterium]
MTFIKWDDTLSIKINEIDNQHKSIFELANNLHINLKSGRGNIIIKRILKSLYEYAETHFNTEEKWMEKYNYPDFEKHKQEHKTFFSEIYNFERKYEEGAPLLARNILLYLSDWFRKHIVENDKKFGKFLEEKNIKLNNL